MKICVCYGLLSLIVLANCQNNNEGIKDIKSGKGDKDVTEAGVTAGVTVGNVAEGDYDDEDIYEYDEVDEYGAEYQEGDKDEIGEGDVTKQPTNKHHNHGHGVHGYGNDHAGFPRGFYVYFPFNPFVASSPAVDHGFNKVVYPPNYGYPDYGVGHRPHKFLGKRHFLRRLKSWFNLPAVYFAGGVNHDPRLHPLYPSGQTNFRAYK